MTADTVATRVAPVRPVSIWRALHSVHRLEVSPNLFLVLVWGMFVAADRPSGLWSLAAVLGLGINALSMFGGFALNSYSDYPIDRRTPLKAYVAHGVERLGARTVLAIYWVEQVVTVGTAVVVSILLHNFAVVWVKLLGIAAGYLYNAEPIRLKRRGLWNPVMMSIRFGFVPGLIAYLCVHGGRIGAGGWLLLVAMTFAAMSYIGFWASVSDTEEDTEEHIRTASVVLGALRTMRIAVALMVVCTVLGGLGLATLFGPWAGVGALGALGVLGHRIRVLRRATDDRSAIALLRTMPVIRGSAFWDRLLYVAVIAVGAAHFLFLAG